MTEVDVDEEILKNFSSTIISNKSKKDSKSTLAQNIGDDTNITIDGSNNENNGKDVSIDQMKQSTLAINNDSNNGNNKSKNNLQSLANVKNSHESVSKSKGNVNNGGGGSNNSLLLSNDSDENQINGSKELNEHVEGEVVDEEDDQSDYSESIESISDLKKIAYLNNAI
eukprot:jgi/Orpsp1_1/1188654/evm.model.d7180000066337.1